MSRSRILNTACLVAAVRETHFSGRVLDLGIGNGMTAAALRHWVEPEIGRAEQICEMVGVELFEDYDSPLWVFYDSVVIGNIVDVVAQLDLKSFDLVLLIDVIEHIERAAGEQLMAALLAAPRLYVCTPDGWSPNSQGTFNGVENEHEKHISAWHAEDFQAYGMKVIRFRDGAPVSGLIAYKWPEDPPIRLEMERL